MASPRKTKPSEAKSEHQQETTPFAVPGIRIMKPYGFQDEFGDLWFWHAGAVVRNPYVLELLSGRIAPTEPLE